MNLGSRRLGAGCSTCGGGVNHPTNQCDERKVVSISKAGDSLIIALDDCTFFLHLIIPYKHAPAAR